MAWWRAYDEAVDDPKLQNLAPELFRAWFNLMCLASRNAGKLPPLADIAFGLRRSEKEAKRLVDALVAVRLLDVSETAVTPHNWNKRQYKTDVSTNRVKAFRERHKKPSQEPSETVSRNAPETEQRQSRAETETDSVPIGTGADAPGKPPEDDLKIPNFLKRIDPVKVLFDEGVALLGAHGTPEKQARSLIGKWRQKHGDEPTQTAINAAIDSAVTEPVAWIEARLGKPRETWDQKRQRENLEVIEAYERH